jgi:hypothetical protein
MQSEFAGLAIIALEHALSASGTSKSNSHYCQMIKLKVLLKVKTDMANGTYY